MEWVIFSQSLRENLRAKRFLPWLGLGFLCLFLTIYWPQLRPGIEKSDQYGSITTMFVFHILALTAAIVTASIVAQEIEQKTIVYLVTRPVPRWKLAIFRFLACSIVVALSVIIDAVLVSAGTYGTGSNPYLVKDLLAVLLGSFAYCALFMLVGMLFNRAMIICLLFAFGWEWAVPKMPGQMSYLSINSYVQAIAQHPSTDQSAGQGGVLASTLASSTITPTEAYLALGGTIVVCAAFAAFWFATNEYLPREDAE